MTDEQQRIIKHNSNLKEDCDILLKKLYDLKSQIISPCGFCLIYHFPDDDRMFCHTCEDNFYDKFQEIK